MKRLLFLWLIGACLLGAEAERGQSSALSEHEWSVIRDVINGQIEALEKDDAETAFTYVSPALRELFKTPDQFIAMIRQNYAAVYRPRAVTFLPPSVVDNVPVQPVQVLAPDGSVVVALYSMQRQSNEAVDPSGLAAWKINGCQLVPLDAVFAATEPEPVAAFMRAAAYR